MNTAFGYGRRNVNEEWKKVPNEAINNLLSSHNVIRMNKSKRMKQPIWRARET
jgi:hypothetical protein